MKYLLDTCIISELIAKRPNQTVLDWLDSQVASDLYLSVITIGELTKGIRRLPDSRRKADLEHWLENDLLSRFSGRTPTLDLNTMILWGNLIARLEVQGRVLPLMDSLIAATVLHGGFTLITRNEKDFIGTGVPLINLFTE
ncbi:type II toxin-antitoxin system VapC family toxin [Alkalinema pantanalense CENA528]|uniref:type II toxin-antitoxin system VapC family toxin n=1 Tax=Alkalinema pantanalense TaxID=1620705 RepID=UPI003D6F07CA